MGRAVDFYRAKRIPILLQCDRASVCSSLWLLHHVQLEAARPRLLQTLLTVDIAGRSQSDLVYVDTARNESSVLVPNDALHTILGSYRGCSFIRSLAQLSVRHGLGSLHPRRHLADHILHDVHFHLPGHRHHNLRAIHTSIEAAQILQVFHGCRPSLNAFVLDHTLKKWWYAHYGPRFQSEAARHWRPHQFTDPNYLALHSHVQAVLHPQAQQEASNSNLVAVLRYFDRVHSILSIQRTLIDT